MEREMEELTIIRRRSGSICYTVHPYDSPYNLAIVRLAAEAYSHVLTVETVTTYRTFADLIAEHYDSSNPQNAEIIRVLKTDPLL